MPQRKITFIEEEYYHIYNRGNSKQQIFHDAADYERFITLLCVSNSKDNFKLDRMSRQGLYTMKSTTPLVAIGAWTIMPNHFHVLVTPLCENGLSKFMQKVTTAYSMYYNQKYKRTGSLFEGKFKAEYVDNDRYLRYLYAYIHLNCLKMISEDLNQAVASDLLDRLASFAYSSYLDYMSDEREWGAIITPSAFPEYFAQKGDMKNDLLEWIMYRKDLDI